MNLPEALGNPFLKKIIGDIISAAKPLGIDFFCIGALARNAWYAENDLPVRGTRDVDFGVYIPNRAAYSALKNRLTKDYGYTQVSTNVFCLVSPDQIPVDLLPFGDLQEQDKVITQGINLTSIDLAGLEEVYQHGLRTIAIEGEIFRICTIPSVVLLKLIAFDDRPEHRSKDAMDIASICHHYPYVESELIWEEYNFLYEGEMGHEEVGIVVLGYEIRKIIKDNSVLYSRIINILNDAISLKNNLAVRMIIDTETETVIMKVAALKLLKAGITDEFDDAGS